MTILEFIKSFCIILITVGFLLLVDRFGDRSKEEE